MKELAKKVPLTLVVAAVTIVLLAGPVCSAEWLWQADNHTGDLSYFTNKTTSFKMYSDGGWEWRWDEPAASAVSVRGKLEKYGRAAAVSSDFGAAFDIDKGITVAARVKPINAHGEGNLCLSVANASTADLPGGSTHLWIGWNEPDAVWIGDRNGIEVRSFESSVKYEGSWCVWTLSGKQIGQTVAWDVWIDGVLQGANRKAPDGSLHTAVFTEETDGLLGTAVAIGERCSIDYPHDTIWDYVSVSNDGVLAGWDGGVAPSERCAAESGEQSLDRKARAASLRANRLLEAGRKSEALQVVDEAVKACDSAGPAEAARLTAARTDLSICRAMILYELNRLDEAVKECDATLAWLKSTHVRTTDWDAVRHLSFFKAEALLKQGRAVQALQLCDEALANYKPADEHEQCPETVVKLRFCKAEALIGAKDYGKAIPVLTKWLAENPDHSLARYAKSMLIDALSRAGRVDEAVDLLKQSLAAESDPEKKAAGLLRIGGIYQEAKRYRDAIAAFKEVRKLKDAPAEMKAEATYRSGLCYHAIKYDSSARMCMNEVVQMYSESGWAKKAKGALYVWATYGDKTQVK